MSSSVGARFLAAMAKALREVRLEAIVVGNTASILNGAPVITEDVDLLVRDTSLNRKKLQRFAVLLGGSAPTPMSELSRTERIYGAAVLIDILYDRLPPRLRFEAVRSRAERMVVGGETLTVAALGDVIRSKEAADRPKDRAVLPILRDTLAVKRALAKR